MTADTFDPRAFLKVGSTPDSVITHDGVEIKQPTAMVRLITRKPTHFPFMHHYPMVHRVMTDSPDSFQEMYEWRVLSDPNDLRGLPPEKDSIELIRKDNGDFVYRGTYIDFDGKSVTREIPAPDPAAVRNHKLAEVVKELPNGSASGSDAGR